ncbi:MAG: hypothetical protein NTV73_05010 [Hyphomicrobiales bacterium]|nr:hypothetical protein [Hyphomicrobiales bacterium]
MFNRFKNATLSAIIGLGTLAAIPPTAQADGVYLNYGTGHHGAGIGMQVGEYDRADYRYRDEYRGGRHSGWGCTPYRAVDKAERYGVRRARVVDMNHRSITVAGRKWGNYVRMTFGREPSCPIVRW